MAQQYRVGMIATVVSLLISTLAHAQDLEWPDTRAAEIARAFLDAYNTGETSAAAAFMNQYQMPEKLAEMPAEQRAERLKPLIAQIGTLTPGQIVESKPDQIVVLAEASDAPVWVRIEFTLEGDPGMLSGIAIHPASAPSDSPEWQREEWDSIEQLLQRGHEETGVPAIACVVIQDGSILHEAVVGVRVASGEDRATLDDAFHVGSITKSMTATVAGKLIEQGLIDWDDTLGELLEGIDMREEYKDVTFEQLLQHRAGVATLTSPTPEDTALYGHLSGTPAEQRAEFAAILLAQKAIATPGTSMNYSNGGYGLVAHICEQATGRSWEDLMTEYVFEAVGMQQAGFGWPEEGQPSGHLSDGNTFTPLVRGTYELDAKIDPAGDAYCTARDLAQYGLAHLRALQGEDTILQSGTVKRLHTSLNPTGDQYAGGWIVTDIEGVGPVHWHNGSAGTFFAQLELEPERNRVTAVVMNIGFAGQDVANRIIESVRKH